MKYTMIVADVHGNGQYARWTGEYGSAEAAECDGWRFARDEWPLNQCHVNVRRHEEIEERIIR